MSTFVCPVVKVGKTAKHPNADSLSLTHVGDYCCIFRTEEYKEGDFAVYVPEEALVPERPEWAFLWAHRTKDNKPVREKDRVVKAKKLRGIFSCGLLVKVPSMVITDPLKPFSPAEVGTDFAPILGITKYEAPEQVGGGGDNAPIPGWLPKFTEIENARGLLFNQSQVAALPEAQVFPGFNPNTIRADLLKPGEAVVITEKIHGANARYVYHDGQFYVGSHANVKSHDGTNWWTYVSMKLDMETRCKKCPGYVLFGEVYGQVQKGYEYGLKSPTLVLFDAFSLKERKYVDWDFFVELCRELELPHVPILYKGPWESLKHAAQFADGPTILGNSAHTREGCVVRTNPERWDDTLGRMCLKVIGETYLLSKYADK